MLKYVGHHSLILCSTFDLRNDCAIMKTPPKVMNEHDLLISFPFIHRCNFALITSEG